MTCKEAYGDLRAISVKFKYHVEVCILQTRLLEKQINLQLHVLVILGWIDVHQDDT